MCIVVMEYDDVNHELTILTNRDEFYKRTFDDHKLYGHVFCGLDHQDGGTWAGVTTEGRFAVLTNHRDMTAIKDGRPSRGSLVLDYLRNGERASQAARRINAEKNLYNGFNMLIYDGELWFVGARYDEPRKLPSGIYTLSNGSLDGGWLKERLLKSEFKKALMKDESPVSMLNLLESQVKAPDYLLPYTGLAYELERLVSSIYIESDTYGTVSKQYFKITPQGIDFLALNRDQNQGNWHWLDWNWNFGYNNT